MNDSIGSTDGVIPVASDLDSGASRRIVACEVDAVDRGKRLGEQAVLQRDCEIVLALEEECALNRLGNLLGEGCQQRPFALAQRTVGGDESKAADDLAFGIRDRKPVQPVQPPA